MLHLPMKQSNAFEARFYIQGNGTKSWHVNYRKPQVGISVRGIDLSNPKILGYGFGVASFFSVPVILKKRVSWCLEMAAGLGYLTRKFDYQSNYKNIAIGSNINAFAFLGTKLSYQISTNLYATSSLSFNHFSNAAYSLPNLGLNYPMASLGAGWLLNPRKKSEPYSGPIDKVKSYWSASVAFGIKELPKPRNKKFTVFSTSFERITGLNKKSSLLLGMDMFYNSGLKAQQEFNSEKISAIENLQIGIHVGYQIHIDKFSALIATGAYAKSSYKQDGYVYHRVGMRYFFNEHLGAQLTLKTHLFKADFFELGTAFRF